MISLSYHPAFDAFHCIFRILRIHAYTGISEIEVDKLRIIDYYLLFPWRVSSIRLVQKDVPLRRIAKKLESEKGYATLPSGELLLERMSSAQAAAMQTLAQDGVIDTDKLRYKQIHFMPIKLPLTIRERIALLNSKEQDKMELISALLEYNLFGPNGLKDRTSLLEHRYDKI